MHTFALWVDRESFGLLRIIPPLLEIEFATLGSASRLLAMYKRIYQKAVLNGEAKSNLAAFRKATGRDVQCAPFWTWEHNAASSSSEEDDPEIIIHVPCTCDVKLKSISVIGGSEGTSPSRLKV